MSKTPKHLRCGKQLKTTTCKRSAWWPGGKCPQHGHGAESFEDWARGMAAREEGPAGAKLRVQFSDWTKELTWDVSGWSGGKYVFHAHAPITVEELSVVSDMLYTEGVLDLDQMEMVGNAIVSALREKVRERGDATRAVLAAQALRKLGITAMASDDYVFLPVAEAEALVERLK